MEKWKKLVALAASLYLLHMYLVVTIGYSNPEQTRPLILFATRIIPQIPLIWAFISYRDHKGKGYPELHWKTIAIFFFVVAVASYLFIPYLYLNPGFSPTPGVDQILMIGAFFYATVCLYIVYHSVKYRENIV